MRLAFQLVFPMLLLGCVGASAEEAGPAGQVLEQGGALELAALPAQTVALEGDRVVAWAMTEIPAASRLQAAFALADALVRAELLKAVRVGLAAASKDVLGERGQLELETASVELARGLVPRLPLPEHGWRKLQRGGTQVLQVFARLSAPRAELEAGIAAALPGNDTAALAHAAAAHLAAAPGGTK